MKKLRVPHDLPAATPTPTHKPLPRFKRTILCTIDLRIDALSKPTVERLERIDAFTSSAQRTMPLRPPLRITLRGISLSSRCSLEIDAGSTFHETVMNVIHIYLIGLQLKREETALLVER
jgi:hypothetical protein